MRIRLSGRGRAWVSWWPILLGACGGDAVGPGVGDEVRVPLAAAIREAQRSGQFVAFGPIDVAGLVGVAIAQMEAAGGFDRSRDESGSPTDPISSPRYDATAFLITYDIVTPSGFRLRGEALNILGWAGLDRNLGVAEALVSVGAMGGVAVEPGTFGVSSAGSHYYYGPTGQTWENSPSIEFDLLALTRPGSARPCRGAIPATVVCAVFTGPGRAAGSFRFFAHGVTPGQPQSVLEFRPTSFDLPLTALRIVDTARYAER